MKPSSHINLPSPRDTQIDAALNVYARANPVPGMESRVTEHIAAAMLPVVHSRRSIRTLLFRRLSAGALAAAAACGIIVGSIEHSRTLATPMATMPQSSSDKGFGPASGGHLPTHIVPATPSIDPNNPRTPPHTRARLSRNPARHPNGAAVPSSPFAAGQNDSERPQQ